MTTTPNTPAHRPTEEDRYLPYALAAAPAAIGCAMGVLVGGKLKEKQRPTAALALLSVGVVAALPFAIDYVSKQVNGPGTKRSVKRRLRSIRDAGIPAEEDIYGSVPEDEVVTF